MGRARSSFLPLEAEPDAVYEAEVLPYVARWAEAALTARKPFGIVGGDHSVPLGAHHALQKFAPAPYGVLHIDAHADLRSSYDGLRYSHATILYHISQLPQVERIVAVGVRDWAAKRPSTPAAGTPPWWCMKCSVWLEPPTLAAPGWRP